MRVLFAFALLALLIPQMQPIPQDDSGLKLVQLSFEKKWVEQDRLSGGMVSNQPPVLNNSTIMLPESTKGENPVITRQQEKARVSNAVRSAIKVKRNDTVIAHRPIVVLAKQDFTLVLKAEGRTGKRLVEGHTRQQHNRRSVQK